MTNFGIGLSALRTNQVALDIVANNIANANTEGFHRRTISTESLSPNEIGGIRIGRGVNIAQINRIRHSVTEASITNVISDVNQIDQLLIIERQIQETLVSGGVSMAEELDLLFAEITELTASPSEPSQRASVIETAQRLTDQLRDASSQLNSLNTFVKSQLQQEVSALNEDMLRLADLNVVIRNLQASGANAASELDERDTIINSIAEVIGLTRTESVSGELNLIIGTASIQQASFQNIFHLEENDAGEIELFLDNSDTPTSVNSGRIAALQEVLNTTIPKYQDKLDVFASELIQQFDSIHATAVGPSGAFQQLTANRHVSDRLLPLGEAGAGAAFPIQAGNLTISITDSAGEVRNETIAIDPAVDSLQDVADRVSALSGLNAIIGSRDNNLHLFADNGLKFDFTGSVETTPDLTGFTGTSVPELNGHYTGNSNQTVSLQIVGTGDVGITEDLSFNLLDENGGLIRTVEIGRGYEAGTPLDLGDGIQITFPPGTVTDGETLTTDFVSEPDETGILAALGLNSFFRGTSAGDIRISDEILADPERFASGKTSDEGDTQNLFSLLDLENANSLPGDLTLSQFMNEVNTELGFEISADVALNESLTSLQAQLESDRDGFSGVDINEELVNLQKYQRSYEAAARVIQAADDMLSSLFNILR